jgi:hypothetical protein
MPHKTKNPRKKFFRGLCLYYIAKVGVNQLFYGGQSFLFLLSIRGNKNFMTLINTEDQYRKNALGIHNNTIVCHILYFNIAGERIACFYKHCCRPGVQTGGMGYNKPCFSQNEPPANGSFALSYISIWRVIKTSSMLISKPNQVIDYKYRDELI